MAFLNPQTKRVVAGKITIPANQTSVNVSLGLILRDYAVVLTPEINRTCWVTNKTTSGFTINISSSNTSDFVVYYIVKEI
jgi:hypothetical protein